jgi:hypothetical protein
MSEANLETKYKELQTKRSILLTRLKLLNKGKYTFEDPLPVPGKRRRSPLPFTLATEKPPALEDPESVRKRNKNVFNSMLGHLQRAKERLVKDKTVLETQNKATQKVVEDLKKQEDERREQVREELNVRASNSQPDTEEAPH